jgi:hypothetical protein
MDDDFDQIFNELDGDTADTPEPTWRATIRRSRLTLTNWAPWLITGGPLGTLLPGRARAGVTIADLTIHGAEQDEISVRYLVRAESGDEAQEVLLAWAQRVGYTRVWLPDCVMVELDPDPDQLTRVHVRCDVCLSRWSDGSPDFWLGVRAAKTFPKWCPMCGCEMSQWTEYDDRRKPTSRGRVARWTTSDSSIRQRQEKT